jgi:hypothetical protein
VYDKTGVRLNHFREDFTEEQYTTVRDFLLCITEGRLVKDVTNPFLQARFLREHPNVFNSILLIKHGHLGKYDLSKAAAKSANRTNEHATLQEQQLFVEKIYAVLKPLVTTHLHIPPGNKRLNESIVDTTLATLYPQAHK